MTHESLTQSEANLRQRAMQPTQLEHMIEVLIGERLFDDYWSWKAGGTLK